METGSKIRKGFTRILYRNLLEKLVGMLTMIILARQLSPYDFGLVAITEALIALVSVVGTTGLAEFLLAYRGKDIRRIFRSAFWFNVSVSLVIAGLVLWLGPIWGHIHEDERIGKLSWIVAGIFFCAQLQIIPKAWLSRHLDFDKQVRVQAPFIFLIAGGKLVAVFMGWGVYSLVIPSLIFQPILSFFLYWVAGFRPGWQMGIKRWKEILQFTRHLIGANLLSRIADQGDKLILGKFLGLEVLGVYQIALQLAELVTGPVSAISNNILSALLPRYVDHKEQFYQHYFSFLKTLGLFLFPILGICCLSAIPLIYMIYGPGWEAARIPFQILLVYAGMRAITSSYGSVLNSFHQNKKAWLLNLAYTPFHLVFVATGAYFGGVAGLALAVVTVKFIFQHLGIIQIMTVMGKPWREWYRELSPYFLTVISSGILIGTIFSFWTFLNAYPMMLIVAISIMFILLYSVLFRGIYRLELLRISAFLKLSFPKSQLLFHTWFRL